MVNPKEHWKLKAEELKKDKKFEEAVKILDKVQELEKDERKDDFWYKKAIHYCDLGEYEQAKNALDKDLETNQKSYETFFLLGKILLNLHNHEESLEFFNKAWEEKSRQHLRNSLKIDQMKNIRKFEEAVKYSDLVHQEKQIDSEFWFHKGMVLFHLKKYKESSLCFEKILKENQNSPKVLYELAKSELWAGNIQNSLNILEKTCLIEPQLKEKLRIDKEFNKLAEEKKFLVITRLLDSEF